MKLYYSLLLSLTAVVSLGSATTFADRVGNDNKGLAIPNIDKETAGMDSFHKIIYAFDRASKVEIKNEKVVWIGFDIWNYLNPDNNKVELIPPYQSGLYLRNTIREPLFPNVTHVDILDGYDPSQVLHFKIPEVEDVNVPSASFIGKSLIVNADIGGAWSSSKLTVEVRQFGKVLVGERKAKPGSGCKHSEDSNEEARDAIAPVDGVCNVFYFYEKHDQSSITPKAP
jgi:hypothetical protein